MSIVIDSQKCTGCGRCCQVCPGNLLYMDDETGKTCVRYPKDCWGCTSCVKECSSNAINYYLGADIGGKGAYLYTSLEGNCQHWVIVTPNGEKRMIIVDKNKANEY